MLLFLASQLALALGPIVYAFVPARGRALALIDGFVFVSMSGLVLVAILPEAVSLGGIGSLAFVGLGFIGPSIVERYFHRLGPGTHSVSILLGMIGLCLHGVVDGVALLGNFLESGGELVGHASVHEHVHEHGHTHLPMAVVLHRLPVGLTVWWLLRPRFGWRLPAAVLAGVVASTTVGFLAGGAVLGGLSSAGVAWFQAFVVGSLLHVVFHRPHAAASPCGHRHESGPGGGRVAPAGLDRSETFLSGIGAVIGLALVAAVFFEGHAADGTSAISEWWARFLDLALVSAPPLVIAYGLAGLIHAVFPASSVAWLRRGRSWSQSLRGMAVGLPFPICSCGVVPLYRTLSQQGAPPAAALAFLVATPEVGLDAVLLSVPFLGTRLTVVRVVTAAILAFLVGWIAGSLSMRWAERTRRAAAPDSVDEGANGLAMVSACDVEPTSPTASSNPPAGIAESEAPASCCDPSGNESTLGERLTVGFRKSLGEGVDHTAPWILAGLILAAILAGLPIERWFEHVPASLEVLAWALVGVPMYVCASGATPLVAILLASGVSPGAGLAFLLTGPATNVSTFGVVAGVHGRRTAVLFSVLMVSLAVSAGYLVNGLLDRTLPLATAADLHADHGGWLAVRWVALGIVSLLCLASLVRRGPRRFVAELIP